MSLQLYYLSLEYFDIFFGTQQVLSKRKEFLLDDPQTTTGGNAKYYKVGLVFKFLLLFIVALVRHN